MLASYLPRITRSKKGLQEKEAKAAEAAQELAKELQPPEPLDLEPQKKRLVKRRKKKPEVDPSLEEWDNEAEQGYQREKKVHKSKAGGGTFGVIFGVLNFKPEISSTHEVQV